MWIGSAPSGMIQKYSHDGSKLLLQIGKKGVFDSSDGTVKGQPLNSNAAVFFMPSSIFVDPKNGDIYVSDGEGAGGNRRIAVLDREGKFLRQWQPEGMKTVHCLSVSNDGLVYVCNRDECAPAGLRQDGKLQKEHRDSVDAVHAAGRRQSERKRRRGGIARSLARSPISASCI